jgi:hypothetical protein
MTKFALHDAVACRSSNTDNTGVIVGVIPANGSP